MKEAFNRHDMSDEMWEIIEPHLPGQKGQWGGVAEDNRLFVDAVFWVLRTGAPWRDLPPSYGNWNSQFKRYSRWRDNGTWESVLEAIVDEPDFEWLMIDATFVKIHQHGAGAVGGTQGKGLTKGGPAPRFIWPWMRLVCRSDSLLQRVRQRTADMLSS